MRIFIKNDEGKPSVSLTMVVVSFTVVTLWLVAWVVGVASGHPVPPFDAMAAMGYLTPILSLYFGRRWTSKTDAVNKTTETELGDAVPRTPSNPPSR